MVPTSLQNLGGGCHPGLALSGVGEWRAVVSPSPTSWLPLGIGFQTMKNRFSWWGCTPLTAVYIEPQTLRVTKSS